MESHSSITKHLITISKQKRKTKKNKKDISPYNFYLNYFKNTEIHFKTITKTNLFYIYVSVTLTKHIFIAYKPRLVYSDINDKKAK